MRFIETPIRGAFVIDLELREDSRGFFARAFCAKEFAAHGLKTMVAQTNISSSFRKGTIRGLHYQALPHPETKLFRCTRGANYHVIVDLRAASPTYLHHFGVELSTGNRKMLYVPELCAHGYQAQTDGAEATYQAGGFYEPAAERGLRYDDPSLGIAWPLPVPDISPKDLAWPLLNPNTPPHHDPHR